MHIMSTDSWIVVTNPTPPNPSIDTYGSQQLMSGMVRYNPSLRGLEVFDGRNQWYSISDAMLTTNIGLSSSAGEVLAWAYNKMKKEKEYERVAIAHPAIKTAMENFKKAAEHLDVMVKIVTSEDETDSGTH